MPTILDLSGLEHLKARFKKIQNPDARPLIKTLMDVIHNDNRRGVLAGTDKNGNPMKPVTYRPGTIRAKPTAAQRGGAKANARAGKYNAGSGANLSSAEYRKLDGPPLAPRGQFSRVITNLLTDFDDSKAPRRWEVWGYWDEVVSNDGTPFLKYHFEGAKLKGKGRLPRRDLRGIRPEGRALARQAARNWMRDQVKTYG